VVLIDAHCHASPLWFEPVEPLVFQMDQNGVAKGVLTQVLGQFDNAYQEECVARFPGRLASVGAVDAGAGDAAEEVRRWAARGMVGLRLRPEARSPGADPLAVWRAAADCGLAISCGGAAGNIVADDFAALAGEFSAMPIVLEQLGGWTRPDCDGTPETWRGILDLARFANISLKIPTLGQIAPRQIGKPLPNDGSPVLDASQGAILLEALGAFGAERLLWGSDFPVVASREGYANALNWTRALFDERPTAEVAAIFGGNAERIFFPRSA
jgi:L-fuconolactonase